MSADERAEVKKVARELLNKMKLLLVLNWRQKSTARSQLKLTIEDVLDTLPPAYDDLLIFVIVLLGRLERESQAGVLRPVATGRRKARVRTLTPRIRFCVMRRKARSTCAHCPKLEPLLEHDNHKSS